jgi:hypothetical protein
MLYREKQIKELYNLKHMADDKLHQGADYENELLRNFLSPVLYNNQNLVGYLDRIQNLLVLMIEEVNYVRNFYHTAVDKHYGGYNT